MNKSMRVGSLLCSIALVIAAGAAHARPVLIEEFTGTWCGYCYGAGLALDQVEANYPRSSAIVLVYHDRDPFELDVGIDKYYYYDLFYVPTTIFNGVIKEEGFGSSKSQGQAGVTNVYNKFVADIAQETSRTAGIEPFTLTLTGNTGPLNPEMTLTVRTATGYPNPVKARFFIAEDGIAYAASNGQTVLNGVARASLGEQQVSLPSAGGEVTLNASYSGSVPCVDSAKLRPVVFLQDDSTKEIMAAIGQFTMTSVWVDFSYAGAELGTSSNPFSRLAPAIDAVADQGTINIRAGSSSETPRIARPMWLVASGGTARIGAAIAMSPPRIKQNRTATRNAWTCYR